MDLTNVTNIFFLTLKSSLFRDTVIINVFCKTYLNHFYKAEKSFLFSLFLV